jgi:uncharacterized paraquat-inducible protein A
VHSQAAIACNLCHALAASCFPNKIQSPPVKLSDRCKIIVYEIKDAIVKKEFMMAFALLHLMIVRLYG